jgi:spore germination cell wall hydrolase CwlJ-like protein
MPHRKSAPMIPDLQAAHRTLRLTGFVGALAVLFVAGAVPGAATAPAAHGTRAKAHAIALAAGGDYSQVGFDAAFADMDPAMAAFARRFVPSLRSLSDYETAETAGSEASGEAEYSARNVLTLSWDAARLVNASIPISSQSRPVAAPFRLQASPADRARAVDCLAQAVYYEAAYEVPEGQAAVAQVVLNRLRHPLYPKTVCAVVFQGSQLSTGCQFSFTCDGALARPPVEPLWGRARAVAERALDGHVVRAVGTATHYHADYVVPYWIPSLAKLNKIGAHIFYRWSGGLGLPGAFTGRYAGGEPLVGGRDALELAQAEETKAKVAALLETASVKPAIQIAAAPQLAFKAGDEVATASELTLEAPKVKLPQREAAFAFRPNCVASTLGNCPF